MITKVEGLVYNTNTSQSPKMKAYYAYWEKQIFSTLSEVNSHDKPMKFSINYLLVGYGKFKIIT